MLADVIKQREKERQDEIDRNYKLYNRPIKRDTILFYDNIYRIGGIEKWIYSLGKRYEFSVVYDRADAVQLKRLNDIGVETVMNVGQPIECNTLITMLWCKRDNIKAKKKLLFVHALYAETPEIPEYDEIYAVSKVASNYFNKVCNIKPKVMYNPVDIDGKQEPLIFGVFSRLSKEKGKDRIIYLLDELNKCGKPYLMLIFTDLPFNYNDSRVVFINPTLDNIGWMKKCDYIVQLSDTEAACLTMQEALKLGIPLITTRLEMLDEFEINESNAKILDFDMKNLNINDLWNIPIVKDWHEPISKEWEDIMKKRVLREKRSVKPIEEVKEEKPKTTKKVKK